MVLNKSTTPERVQTASELHSELTQDIQTMSDTQFRRAQIRLRVIDYQQGKQFYQRLKPKQINIPITQLKKPDGSLTKSQKDNLNESKLFYQKLFYREPTEKFLNVSEKNIKRKTSTLQKTSI